MRSTARLIGLTVGLLALLTTCSVPFAREGQPRLSGFVAQPGGRIAPTVLPSVTPAPAAPPVAVAAAGVPAAPAPDPSAAPLSANMVPAGPTLTPQLVAAAEAMDAHLRAITEAGYFRGAALVAYQGRVLLSRGYGPANQAQGLENTQLTRFRLASVSKPITALAIMRLQAAGKLDVRASICTYLPDCPQAWGGVTVEHLLRHVSGIPNYTDFLSFADVEAFPATPEQVIARFREMPLGYTPGSLYQYCNSNYVLLGRIIEAVSGQSYAEYLRDQIFAPLGMADSGYDPGGGDVLGGTQGYYAGGNPDTPLDTSNLYAAGGLYSTVEDLYKLSQALDAGTLLPPELAEAMYTPYYFSYGYGWKIEERHGRRVIYHPGMMSGAATYFGRYPDAGLTVILLSNMRLADTTGTADYLAGLVFR